MTPWAKSFTAVRASAYFTGFVLLWAWMALAVRACDPALGFDFRSAAMLLFTLCAAALAHGFVVLVEEPALDLRFGEDYLQYKRSVRRWLPRFTRMDDIGQPPRPRGPETILLGGAVVALLDIANAMIFWALYRGTPPRVILQSIASGLQGKEAFSGGAGSAWLGAFLHVFIACGVAAVFWLACVLWPQVINRPFVHGAVYGGVVYLVMNQVVLPLSQAAHGPFRLAWFLDNLIGHLLLVGPPVACIAWWSASRNQGS